MTTAEPADVADVADAAPMPVHPARIDYASLMDMPLEAVYEGDDA